MLSPPLSSFAFPLPLLKAIGYLLPFRPTRFASDLEDDRMQMQHPPQGMPQYMVQSVPQDGIHMNPSISISFDAAHDSDSRVKNSGKEKKWKCVHWKENGGKEASGQLRWSLCLVFLGHLSLGICICLLANCITGKHGVMMQLASCRMPCENTANCIVLQGVTRLEYSGDTTRMYETRLDSAFPADGNVHA